MLLLLLTVRIKELSNQITQQLCSIYDEREARNISNYLFESKHGKDAIRQNIELTDHEIETITQLTDRLLKDEPVQYVVNESWFYGFQFFVDKRVLIPRPETEELVELILRENKNPSPVIIDFGTGSGCIPVTLKYKLPSATMIATDHSENALSVARQNALFHQQEIDFRLHDLLNDDIAMFPDADIIMSNPPYIDRNNINTMHQNVLLYEPHDALFPSGNDQLIFYRKLAAIAMQKLIHHGKLYVEIPEDKANEISQIFADEGMTSVTIYTDIQGKQRMISASKV